MKRNDIALLVCSIFAVFSTQAHGASVGRTPVSLPDYLAATNPIACRLTDGSAFYTASGGGGGGGGASQADKSAFTEGTTTFTPVGGVYNETAAGDPAEDQVAAARITAKRGVHVNLRSAAGTEIGTAAAPVRTDPTGTTTQPVSGTVTANVGTTNGLALDATLTGGTAKSIARGAAKGATAAADATATAIDADHTALDVSVKGTAAVTGTVTANAGTNLNTSALALDATLTGGTQKSKLVDTGGANVASVSAAGALKVDNSGVTQPVSGTVAASQSGTWTVQPGNTANTTAWKVDGSAVTQPVSFTQPALVAGSAIVGKVGIDQTTPGTTNKVSIGTDGTVAVNAALPAGTALIGKVGIDQTTPGTTNKVSIGTDGTVAITSVVPGTGATNLGKAEDAAPATGDTGVAMLGVRTDPSTTSPVSANGDYIQPALDYMGAVPMTAHPGRFSCFVPLTATVMTQCQAAPAAGLRAYVTSLQCSNGAATVQGVDVTFGTGANCATGTTALTHKYQMGTNGTTTSPIEISAYYGPASPLVPTAANAICVRPTAATAFGCTITGFIAP